MVPFRFLCVAWLAGALAPTVPFTLTGRAAEAATPAPPAPAAAAAAAATAGNTAALGTSFESQIRPLLKEYCLGCHSTEKHKGDLDLERFNTLNEVLRHPKVWLGVIDQLALGEMPPKDKPQPSAADKDELTDWVNHALDAAAEARAGDPGPIVLRRLNNAEYTYTIRDLTGVASLDPAKEFPADSAAGEGFMNTGSTLVMSPALLGKYLDAAKGIAAHAMLLPDGIRFSPSTTRRDWTEETLASIRGLYREFTDARGADKVNLQGIVFDTNEGGRLPVERYLAATLEWRDRPAGETATLAEFATRRGLSPKYLVSLHRVLTNEQPSFLLDGIRARWRTARPADANALAAAIGNWQKALWKFNSVGHIGKAGGPPSWLEAVTPLAPRQELRVKLAAPTNGNEVVLYLSATDAGDGNTDDVVVWQQPRLVVPGRPDLMLRDVRDFTRALAVRRDRVFGATAKALAAAAEASAATNGFSRQDLAARHQVDPDALQAWLDYLGIGSGATLRLDHFKTQIRRGSNYDFVNGWGSNETPNLMANSSTQHVRIPGNLRGHGVVVHPSPKLNAAVGWQSPVDATVRVNATVTHAHPECGNGVTWSLELRRGNSRQRLATGVSQGGRPVPIGPFPNLQVQTGDLISLLIGPRDGNHSCDLTDVELVITPAGADAKEWRLTADVSSDVLAANPHADRQGRSGVWHFYTEPVSGTTGTVIPPNSLLARWQSTADPAEKARLATAVQELLTVPTPPAKDSPDGALHRQLSSLGGPLFAGVSPRSLPPAGTSTPSTPAWGLDPQQFGRYVDGGAIESENLCVQAPSVIEVRLPADLVAGAEFVASGTLHPRAGGEGSVQLQVTTTRPAPAFVGPQAATVTVIKGNAPWTANDRSLAYSQPIIVRDGSPARRRIEAGFQEFREWFPAALCYVKIVPVDEVVTLTLFYREDQHLARLMLDDAQAARLNRLWDEMHFLSQDALTLVDAYEQLWQYATQDADPKVFEPMRQPIMARAAAFRQQLTNTQPAHLDAVLEFAGRAYRRPLTSAESGELRALYRKLRQQELPHDDAIRLTLARVLVAPNFLYRLEQAGPGEQPAPVNDFELATRLSYFLWSSTPDAELLSVAAAGRLRDPDVLAGQARRMMKDPKVRRLGIEFACTWLHIHDFPSLDEKSERHFPTFAGLREPMYEEAIRYFTDLFQRDGSILSVFDSDYTFLNEDLAKHYGIPGVKGPEWRRVDGVRQHGRGGILGLGATLAKQSGASRTSPILRGNWIAEVLLGEKLPRPPKDVPRLPEDEAAETLTVRQLVEKHSNDPRCSSCHRRIDPFGYAMEGFDAIGRARVRDLGNRPLDTRVKLLDGTDVTGMNGLREYLSTRRRDTVLRQFNRKLLGYALGRSVLLSDKPLLVDLNRQLEAGDHRIGTAVESIVRSRQFREIRGRDAAADE